MKQEIVYNGERVDKIVLDNLQANAEAGLNLDGSAALLRTGAAPALPGYNAGALSGFALTYDPVTLSCTLAGSVAGGTRSIAVTKTGMLVEMTAASAPIDLTPYEPVGHAPGLAFEIWATCSKAAGTLRNMVVFTVGVGEGIVANNSVNADTLSFVAIPAGGAPPDATYIPIIRASSWLAGVPVTQLCGPLRDLTAHAAGATDLSKPETLADALKQAAVAYAMEHYPPGHASAGHHSAILANLLGFSGAGTYSELDSAGNLVSIGGAAGSLRQWYSAALALWAQLGASGFEILGDYGYLVNHTFNRSISAAAFQPIQNSLAVPVPIYFQGKNIAALAAAGAPTDAWTRISQTAAGEWTEGGWAILAPSAGDVFHDTMMGNACLVAPLDWVPNGTQIHAASPTWIYAEADAAWGAVASQQLAFAVMRREIATGTLSCMAYARFSLIGAAAALGMKTINWQPFMGVTQTFDHSRYHYHLVAVCEDSIGGFGTPMQGTIGFYSFGAQFGTVTLGH